MFRFPFHQLRRLFNTLRLPQACVLENGSVYQDEEVFLLSLNRLTFPERLITLCKREFGREHTQAGRAFKYFINHVYNHFADLLFDNLEFWTPYFPMFAEKIQAKMASYGLTFPPGVIQTICASIDANIRKSCRPAGGPVRPGPNAPRHDPRIQEAFYNGWGKGHGLKFLTVESPLGCIDMYGTQSRRRNDLLLLAESNINTRFRDAQRNSIVQHKMYGDDIFPTLSHLRVKWAEGPQQTPRQRLENRVLKKIREPIEWSYGLTANLFGYVDWKKNNKILAGGAHMGKVTLFY
jgi:hypothetical protein